MRFPLRRNSRWVELPVYPVLLSMSIVLDVFLNSGGPWSDLWRPLAISVAVASLLLVGVTAVVRSPHIGAYIASVVVLLVGGVEVLAAACLVFLLAARIHRLRQASEVPFPWQSVTRLGNLASALVLVTASVAVAASGPYAPSSPQRAAGAPADGPDVYFVLLDGHPRADVIRQQYGANPDEFLESMAGLGFMESPLARSNYNRTDLTLTSMMTGSQIDDLDIDRTKGSRVLMEALNDGRMLQVFRDAGYELISIPPPSTGVAIRTADRYLDSGDATSFEFSMLRLGWTRFVLPDVQRDWATDQLRHRTLASFAALESVAAETPSRPRFVFAHIASPHAPIVFGPDGSKVPPSTCFPTCMLWAFGPDDRPRLADQIAFIDQQVLKTVQTIQERSSRPPVIVVFSDHGSRFDIYDSDENLRSFLLASTPGHPGLFPPNATPVNYLARVASAYLGTSLAFASEESYWSDLSAARIRDVFSYRRVDVPLVQTPSQAPASPGPAVR